MKKNRLLIGLKGPFIRFYLADTTALVEEVREKFSLYPTSAAALGRVLSMSAVMGTMLKDENEQLNIAIHSDGAISTIMCIARPDGSVKGFVNNPNVYDVYEDSGKLAVGRAIGSGTLSVTKSMNMKGNFSSTVNLQTGEIGDDFAFYFAKSEQRPSIVSLGVLVDTDQSIRSAGVFFLELLPGYAEEDIVYLENLAANMQPISAQIKDFTLEEILEKNLGEVEILDERELTYRCDCSRERFQEKLLTLSRQDLLDLAKANQDIKIKCDFCGKTYTYSAQELNDWLSDAESA
ncbi:MAG: Hsp33 family molecular chaperone HslO [Erysipelotrichaceae bacterium]|nr:Hsp33 family molecular chaperone HslO [Erysipelotrichaceae bacterium]